VSEFELRYGVILSMPTYDYRCQACEHAFEEFQSITAKSLRKCPKCGKAKLQRLIGIGAGVIFKGSGFYETDYRSESYKKSAQADSDAAKPAAKETATQGAKSGAKEVAAAPSAEKAATPAPAKTADAPKSDTKTKPAPKKGE
jgi:putative FmdB family regulatory protein